MVLDDVAQRAHGVVEVAPVVDPELLGHRDLHRGDVVAVPDRLEHGVGEPQEQDVLDRRLPEEVIDAVQLRLVDQRVQRSVEFLRRGEVMPERLLDDDARIASVRSAFARPPTTVAKSEGRDLEVEDRELRALDRLGDALVGGGVVEVAGDVGELVGEALEHRLVELLARAEDRLAGTLDELLSVQSVDATPTTLQGSMFRCSSRYSAWKSSFAPGRP